jgi:protein CpxP
MTNRMRKFAVFYGVLFLTAAVAAAQPAPRQDQGGSGQQAATPARRPNRAARRENRMLQRMRKNLNLSSDQVQQLRPIFANMRTQMRSIRQNSSLSQQQRREQMRDARQKTMQQINGVLTPEQQQKWKQLRAQRRNRRGGSEKSGSGNGGNANPPGN